VKKIGFIGYGNMGSIILNGFLFSGAIKPNEIIISTKTESKLEYLKTNYPEIEISPDNSTTASKSNLIFLFVGTADVKVVIQEIKGFISKNTHIIYISAALDLENIEEIFKGKITKVMPSITSEVLEGISLVCHNSAVSEEESNYVNSLFDSIGQVKVIDEADFVVGTDITSCAPAFMTKIFMEFAKTAFNKSRFSREETDEMVIKTLYGTSKLLYERKLGFENLMSSVATKGGITEAGLEILEVEMPEIFNKLFVTTSEKHEKLKIELKEQY
jgi:pyrroline-5-carboxylate reductase